MFRSKCFFFPPNILLICCTSQSNSFKFVSSAPISQVASFGGHLLNYKILTMSVAPRDVHEAQVQFALERGLPAMLGVLSIHRLPYPSRSFDMAHCARCLVPWTARGNNGKLFSEPSYTLTLFMRHFIILHISS